MFLADDNLLVREGVRALLDLEPDLEVVGVAADYDELVARRRSSRSPRWSSPTSACRRRFQNEGIEAAKEVRKRHPGTGVVILSQYDDPEYAISLLGEGAAGYAYLLKDRVERRQPPGPRHPRGRDRRLDARPGDRAGAGRRRSRDDGELDASEEELLRQVAEGRPVKAIAAAADTTPGGGERRDRGALPGAGHGARAPAARARCAGCGCCRRRSSTARSRARR